MFHSWTDFSAQRLSSPGLVSDLISSGLEDVDLSCWSEGSFLELPADIWGSKISWDFSSLRLFPSSSSFSSLDPLCSRWIFKALLLLSLVLYRCPETPSWPRLSSGSILPWWACFSALFGIFLSNCPAAKSSHSWYQVFPNFALPSNPVLFFYPSFLLFPFLAFHSVPFLSSLRLCK